MSASSPVVHRVEVPPDPDAGLAVQPRVAARIGAMHEEDTLRPSRTTT